jgi:SM-20-related protein
MLNEALDWDLARTGYERSGFARIENILQPDYANTVGNALIHRTDWELCYLSAHGPVSISSQELASCSPQKVAEMNREILAKAAGGFAYFYFRRALEGIPCDELREFFDYVRGENFLGFIKYVTGNLGIVTATGQATCYRPSCFLRRHTDSTDVENRAAAYVFGFTPVWQADWGGMLHIQDSTNAIVATHKPAFNTLTLFRVPTAHFVSQVANYAQGARYTTTGWFLTP